MSCAISGHLPSRAGMEPGELGEARSRLLKFLNKSEFYVPERLLTKFPLDGKIDDTFISAVDYLVCYV